MKPFAVVCLFLIGATMQCACVKRRYASYCGNEIQTPPADVVAICGSSCSKANCNIDQMAACFAYCAAPKGEYENCEALWSIEQRCLKDATALICDAHGIVGSPMCLAQRNEFRRCMDRD